jgi:undecaprenyl diphosphate synthase
VLYEPADVEPDLVLVLGPPTRLPPSLVWELAYSELVFEAVALGDLGPEHLRAAISDYHGRRRRFGGLDS